MSRNLFISLEECSLIETEYNIELVGRAKSDKVFLRHFRVQFVLYTDVHMCM
jgi:hypothetical protein